MNAARALAVASVVIACTAAAAPDERAVPTGEQILARAKTLFRARERPPYVVYTVNRRDKRGGVPDLENSYTVRVWCRSVDRNALTRRVWNGKAYGATENITVAFDGYVDPGPPTADIFERALFAKPSPAPQPSPPAPALPTIGGVAIATDYDYRVVRVTRDGDAWRLALAPKRDPARNRIDVLWIDAGTYEVRRMRVRDHLYLGMTGQAIDEEFDARFTQRDGLPLIVAIHGESAWREYETDFTYTDISFPAMLPDWYFEPKSYGRHKDDVPL